MNDWFENRPILHRRVCTLTIHPSIQHMPRFANDDPRYEVMRAAWRESGLIPPICTTASGAIVDGRHRFWYCQEARIEKIATIEVAEEEASLIVLNGLAGHNHATKGQQAYLATPILQRAFEASRHRHRQIKTSGGKAMLPPAPTTDELAKQIGVSESLLWQARLLHEAFLKNPSLKSKLEPQILAAENPLGLGAAIERLGPRDSSTAKPPVTPSQRRFLQFETAWRDFARRSRAWSEFTAEDRAKAKTVFSDTLCLIPADFLDEMTQEIERAKSATSQSRESELAA
jgi:hypothetical protein